MLSNCARFNRRNQPGTWQQVGLGLLWALWIGQLQVMAVPIINDFNPKYGAVGDTILLTGNGFSSSGPITVKFSNGGSGVTATNYVNSETMVTATVPPGVVDGPIGVQVTGSGIPGWSASFFHPIGPGPYVTDMTPALGSTNDAVVLHGFHLTNSNLTFPTVKFPGAAAKQFNPNAAGTQLSGYIPAGATSGPVTVTTSAGTSTNAVGFTLVPPGPYVTSFSPGMGNAGDTILIFGVHMLSVTNVWFAGQPVSWLYLASDSQLQAKAPAGVTSGPIRVNGFTTSTNFFVPPSVSSFSPGSGSVGTTVTLSGVNFLGATTVAFNGTPASSITVVNNATLQAVVPVGATTGLIRVTTPAGTAYSALAFGVQPTVLGFSPSAGPPGTVVTITGANLDEGLTAVKFNGVTAVHDTPSFGQVTATVPATLTGPITVTTTNGTYTTGTNFFLPARVTAFTPTNSAPGSRIKITGTNFLGATTVSFAGAAPVTAYVTNNNVLGATVPAGVVSGSLGVTTPEGTAYSSNIFYAAPIILGFAPPQGLPGASITITGTNLLGTTAVRFNGVDATSLIVSNNGSLQAVVPSAAQTGPITVVAPAGTVLSISNFVLSYASDLALGVTASPSELAQGGILVYTLSLTNRGPYIAPNVWLTNYLPPQATITKATTSLGFVTTNSDWVSANFGPLPVNGSATVELTVAPPIVESLTNVSVVGSDYIDPIDSNSVITTITIEHPLLSVRALPNHQVALSWLTNFPRFFLRYVPTLTSSNVWTEVSTTRVNSNGQFIVIEGAGSNRRFYHLERSGP